MNDRARRELAPNGYLRAGINLANFLLVTGRSEAGDPQGVSPGMAAALAEALGVEVRYVPYDTPGELADAAGRDEWDVGLIAVEPERARSITFSPPYVEIEATYLVPAGSSIQRVADVDREGVRIAVADRTAYELWLTDNIRHAELVRTQGLAGSFEMFVEQQLDALAGLRPGLLGDAEKLPGARVLDGQFTAVRQAIGTLPGRGAAAGFVRGFVEAAKREGRVAGLIERFGVAGRLSVAPPG